MMPLIIGQAPSRMSDPDEPLSGNSGRRLAALCGLDLRTFIDGFERRNLLSRWPGSSTGAGDRFVGSAEARRLAESTRPLLGPPDRKVIVLGFATAAAFGLTQPALTFAPHWGRLFAFCPHPSGVSRWWNDPTCEERARTFWAALARELPRP